MAKTKQTKVEPEVIIEDNITNILTNKAFTRKMIRHHLFMIRGGAKSTNDLDTELLHLLKKEIEKQFKNGMNWENFTFDWDISANDMFKVITPFEWDGKVDSFLGGCSPTAFTKQAV